MRSTRGLLSVLTPIWSTIPETAARLRGRIEAVLDYARAHGFRDGANPAAWRGHLASILPQRPKLAKKHYAAMPYRDVAAFVAQLRQQGTVASLCIEFLILTAARSAEAREATWSEIDLDVAVWSLPAHRMKAGHGHEVPLSSRALTILSTMRQHGETGYVFPGHRSGRPVSSSGVALNLPPRVTLHGFRSSFRDWCGEETDFPREVCEQALAHVSGDQTERAYRRGTALEKRRALMEAWSRYIGGAVVDNVVTLGGHRK